jgi:cysteine desulfurase
MMSSKSKKDRVKKTSKKSVNSKNNPCNEIKSEIIYLDNNSTTFLSPIAKEKLIEWSNCANPSSDNCLSRPLKQAIQKTFNMIENHCNAHDYFVIFTSGATESNCTILRSIAESFKKIRGTGHIISSSVEHHSIIECLGDLEKNKICTVSYIQPDKNCFITPEAVLSEIKTQQGFGREICLVTIMYANNETGAINNIQKIGSIVHDYHIPLHTDSVQLFGKYNIDMLKYNIDILSASSHKFYGPKGVGLLIIKKSLVEGYEMKGIMSGSQQFGLRGGTENAPAIISMGSALESTFKSRSAKNERMLILKQYIMSVLSEHYKTDYYTNYNIEKKHNPVEIIWLSPEKSCLPNTLLLSIAKHTGEDFCNIEFRKILDKNNIILSISSACLTSSDKASHVLTAMNCPPIIKRGTIRISLGDYNTKQQILNFVKKFLELLDSFIIELDKSQKNKVLL